ncbi:hypothetical protein SL053_002444 [Flavobacterium psychrophilum]|nr:hypothetical protein [Flavobacterium psychrophilum]
MKKIFYLIIANLICLFSYSQTQWQQGFEKGFSTGFCYNKIGCTSPTPPVGYLNVGESTSSYNDGYNNGFSVGLNAAKQNSTETNNRQRYQTTPSKYVEEKMSKIDYTDAIAVAIGIRNAKEKAIKLKENGEFQECIQVCKAGLELRPRDVEFMMILGNVYDKNLNDRTNALYYLEKANRLENVEGLQNYINMIKSRN